MPDSNVYPPAQGPEECAEWARRNIRSISDTMRASGFAGRCIRNANQYYAREQGAVSYASGLRPDGKQGENVKLRVNLTRNLMRHILSMVCSSRPPVDPKAENTDAESIRIVEIARAIADHYLKNRRVYDVIDRATEYSTFLPAGYVHCEWDDRAGSPTAAPPHPETGKPVFIYEGDCTFSTPTELDLRYDQECVSWDDLDDLSIRSYPNRYSLAARYPEVADKILAAPGRMRKAADEDEMPVPSGIDTEYDKTRCKVWTYYHRKTPAVPEGICMKMLDDGTVLDYGPLPYADFPVFRVAMGEELGTPHGHSDTTDIAGMQEALDKVWSSITTRLLAHGKPIIATSRGSGLDENQVSGDSITLLETDFEGGKPNVQLLDLLHIPPELMNAPGAIAGLMEGATGVNAIVRGNPPPGLNAGVAINLFQSMAMQFSSPLEGSRARLIESVVKWIFEAHRLHPDVERQVQIVGKSKRQSLQTWYGADLEAIRDVQVDLGNPMAKTVAGRLQILQSLQQNKVPISPDQALQVLNTGNIEHATEADLNELTLIREENEALAEGKPIPAARGENHVLHVQEHIGRRNSVEVKFNPALMNNYDAHIDQHMEALMQGDPVFNVRMGMPPFPMPMPGPGGPGALPPPMGGQMAPPTAAPLGAPPPMAPPASGDVPNPFEPEPLPALHHP